MLLKLTLPFFLALALCLVASSALVFTPFIWNVSTLLRLWRESSAAAQNVNKSCIAAQALGMGKKSSKVEDFFFISSSALRCCGSMTSQFAALRCLYADLTYIGSLYCDAEQTLSLLIIATFSTKKKRKEFNDVIKKPLLRLSCACRCSLQLTKNF